MRDLKIKITVILLLIFAALLPAEFAEAQQLYFREFGLSEGLPQSEVFDATLDPGGSMWFGTNGGGLVRYNGKEMRVFTTEDGLASNAVHDLLTDRLGQIWAAGPNGVAKITAGGKNIRTFGKAQGFPASTSTRMIEDPKAEGVIWVNVIAQQNQLLKIENGQIIEDPRVDSLKTRDIQAVMNLNNKLYLTVSEDNAPPSLWVWDGDKLSRSELNEFEQLKNKFIVPISSTEKGGIRLRAFTGQNDPGSEFIYSPEASVKLAEVPLSGNFRNMAEAKDGSLWTGGNRGAQRLTPDGELINYEESDGLTDSGVFFAAADKEKNIWLGASGLGAVQLTGDAIVNFEAKNGLENVVVRSIYHDSKGRDWLGAMAGVFTLIEDGKAKNYQIPNGGIIGDFFEHEGRFYITSMNSGLFRLENEKVIPAHDDFGLPAGRNMRGVIKEDDGSLLFGVWGLGIVRYSQGDTSVIRESDGLVSSRVFNFMKSSDGKIYTATMSGISVLKDGKVIKNYTSDQGLAQNSTLQTSEDRFGQIWIANFSGGAAVLRPDGSIQTYNPSNSDIASGLTYSVLVSKAGEVWFGTQAGLSRILLDEKGGVRKIENFGKANGVVGEETNGAAISEDPQGRIWVGTIEGAIRIDPEKLKTGSGPAPVRIRDLRMFFRNTDWLSAGYKEFSSSVDSITGLPDRLVLPYDSNHITFDFEAPSLTMPENVRFKWQLEGADRQVSPLSDRIAAEYPNLRPGSYTFKVWATNSAGELNPEPAVYSFTILAPFWQKGWFFALCGLAIFGLGYVGFRAKLLNERRQKEKLGRLVEERTAEVRAQKDDILNKNAELELQQEEILAQNDQIGQQNDQLTSKNKAITDSINYARRIQFKMLPSHEKLAAALPGFFLFFKPRDIVSGDFYWYSEVGNKQIFVLADCTGHGVPGAFMSLTGDAYLNQIVNLQHITEPGKILELLNQGIISALPAAEKAVARDGMDAAVCVIDKSENELVFAGAKRPLLVVKNGNLEEIKGSKFTIGDRNPAPVYETHRIALEEQKIGFYLFSDGFQDQFGGKDGRKFLKRPFYTLLSDIQNLPADEQARRLETEFENWKGAERQIDDISVAGFRLKKS